MIFNIYLLMFHSSHEEAVCGAQCKLAEKPEYWKKEFEAVLQKVRQFLPSTQPDPTIRSAAQKLTSEPCPASKTSPDQSSGDSLLGESSSSSARSSMQSSSSSSGPTSSSSASTTTTTNVEVSKLNGLYSI